MTPFKKHILLAGMLCRKWYVSLDGKNDTECGSFHMPCSSLQYVINNIHDGDKVYVNGSGSDQQPFTLCSNHSIHISFTLEGRATTPFIQCLNDNRKLLELASEHYGYVRLYNLHFVKGYIYSRNIELGIGKCVFQNSSLLVPSSEHVPKYSLGKSHNGTFANQCSFIKVSLSLTVWYSIENVQDIFILCNKIQINILSSTFYHRKMFILPGILGCKIYFDYVFFYSHSVSQSGVTIVDSEKDLG